MKLIFFAIQELLKFYSHSYNNKILLLRKMK